MRTPVRVRHACAVSHGQGAAPDTASRSRGPPAKAGRSRRRRNIVATPGKTVIVSRLRRSATPSGVKRSTRRTALPTSSGASSAPFRPNECESGSAASTTSSGVSAITGPAHERCAKSTAACESSAPFGRPVEPEVYSTSAGATGASRVVHSARSACTSSSTSAGSRSSRMSARSSGFSRGSSGATVTPALSPPSTATTSCQRFGMTRATRSPAWSPRPVNDRASPPARASRSR